MAVLLATSPAHAAQSADSVPSRALAVMKIHCGNCHLPKAVGSNQPALKIFDLSQEEWAVGLTEPQMSSALTRFKDRSRMTPEELKELEPRGAVVPPRPAPEDIRTIEEYFGLQFQARFSRRK